MAAPVVVLAGGTGGAKLARGMLDLAGADLVVIANTGDDIEIHGGHVSPDPDLVTFWLADRVDERGWGLRDDRFAVMEGCGALGEDVWFNLGDQDLAICLARARQLAEGATQTAAADALRRALGVPARVLPMSDAPVRTRVHARRRLERAAGLADPRRARPGPSTDVEFRGAERRAPTAQVLEGARRRTRRRSRPVQPGHLDRADTRAAGHARGAARLPGAVVAVSPLVAGRSVKGPTEKSWPGRAGRSPPTASPDITTGCSTGWSPTSRATRCRRSRPTWRCRTPPAAPRAQQALDFALALG